MMVCTTNCEKATSKLFHKKLKVHLSALPVPVSALRVRKIPRNRVATVGKTVAIPPNDLTHIFDSSLMLAISHAIEDLASEVRTGELISTFQRFQNFEPQRKRYLSLAKDLDAVRVWGSGTPPKRCPHIDFIPAEDRQLQKYWMVLFDSPKNRALLLCKQVNTAETFAAKKYVGFYTFNPYLVQSVRWRFNLLSCGLSKVIRHWEKNFPVPDLKLRDLEGYLKQGRKRTR